MPAGSVEHLAIAKSKSKTVFYHQIKCFQYWPDCLVTELYDSVTIETVLDKQCAFYITRKFVVSHKQVKLFLFLQKVFMS